MRSAVRYAFCVGAVAAILAGCGGSQTFHATPAIYSSSPIAQPLGGYSSLYSFNSKPDGQHPFARLIAFPGRFNGALFGTTSAGGMRCGINGCGTVFEISISGNEKVLYRFRGGHDGAEPMTELTPVGEQLYGTTYLGGVACGKHGGGGGCGTLFSIYLGTTPTEKVLYRFKGVPDGAHPDGAVINVNGTVYGTTFAGGTKCGQVKTGCGTVYSLDAHQKERVLHRFTGKPDGWGPTGNLVFLNGKLYGTTLYGGTCSWGTIFEITLSGKERVLYNPNCTGFDIVYPSGLVAVRAVLYGTSQDGGTRRHGALYSVTTHGEERILQSFHVAEGSHPQGSLISVSGAFYGTMAGGGYGYGNVYTLTTSDRVRVLYRFKGVPDGSTPLAGLAYERGMLYGTASLGGSSCHYQYCQNGFGTVFRLSP